MVKSNRSAPLASLLRPQNISDIIGQEHILSDNTLISKMIDTGNFISTIFWGPPGCGKTSLVSAISKQADCEFYILNATEATIKQLRDIIAKSQTKSFLYTNVIICIDEIHRWAKNQQDVLLPAVENGTIILFGLTTENPKFAVNSTILSRCLVAELKPLSSRNMITIIQRVIEHYKEFGRRITIDSNAIKKLIVRSSGDARKIITSLEAVISALGCDHITEEYIDAVIPDKHLVFDASGNEHFDYAHCYQEAIQHSDVNGAIFWLAQWLESGEDPAYICRRMLITSFEDCASNPHAVTTAMAACYATERTGRPECDIAMALATCEMAMSPRNKAAYYAIKEALKDVRNGVTIQVPPDLRAGTSGYKFHIEKEYVKGWYNA